MVFHDAEHAGGRVALQLGHGALASPQPGQLRGALGDGAPLDLGLAVSALFLENAERSFSGAAGPYKVRAASSRAMVAALLSTGKSSCERAVSR